MRKTCVTIYFLGDTADIENNVDMIMDAIDCTSVYEVSIQVSHEVIKDDA